MDFKDQIVKVISYVTGISDVFVEFASNYLLSYNTKIAFDWSRDPRATC